MNSIRRTVAKNASVLMIAQLITWGLAVLLMIFMPRYLGAAGIGKIQLASSIWAIMIMFTTFGMDTLLTKEIARDPARTSELFGTSILLRAVLFLFGFGFVALYARLAGYPVETIYVIAIVGIANFMVQFTTGFQAVLQGLERMEYVSLSDILSKVFITGVTIFLLFRGYGVLPAAIVLIGGAAIALFAQLIPLLRLQPLHLRVNLPLAWWMLKASFTYLLIVSIRTIYAQVDIVIISLLVNEAVIGWYGVATRLFATLLFIPSVVSTAIFPAMSRTYKASPESLPRLFQKNFYLMLLLGVPIGLGVLVIANPLVVLLFGNEFAKSGPVLAIMGIVLILTYQNMILGQYLISTDRQNTWTVVMAIATVATIPLDIVLIPMCQNLFGNAAIGGALSFVITEAGMDIVGISLLPKGTLQRSDAWLAARIFLSGLVMVAAIWSIRDAFILIPIVAGAISYTIPILALRVIPKEDFVLLKSLMQSAFAWLRKLKSEPSKAGEIS